MEYKLNRIHTKSMTVNNEIQHSVVSEQEIVFEGKTFKEQKEYTTKSGRCMLIRTRSIDDRFYHVIKFMVNGKLEDEETIETNMDEDQVSSFKEEWIGAWIPGWQDDFENVHAMTTILIDYVGFFRQLNF